MSPDGNKKRKIFDRELYSISIKTGTSEYIQKESKK